MKDSPLKETREALKQLFEHEGISRVVCVDDQYREFPDDAINDFIGFLESLDTGISRKNIVKRIEGLKDITFWEDDDADTWKSELEKTWYNADIKKRRHIDNQIKAITSPSANSGDEKDYTGILGEIFGPELGIEFEGLSFTRWKYLNHDYLNPESIPRTLFLFDRDLSNEGGNPDQGIFIIQELHKQNKQVMCGLLSHTYIHADEEKERKAFEEKFGIDKNRFVPIAKSRLDEDPLSFARMVRLTLMSKYCKGFKERASKIQGDALEASKDEINKLNIYDFEHIVFYSSFEEGIWEPDTLFRLFNLYQKKNALTSALNDDDLRNYTDRIRKLSGIPVGSIEQRTNELWKIQGQEWYEEKKYIKSLHLPIALGDIFQKSGDGSPKKYILLAQPCNLMVRPRGKRAHDLNEVVLAEIVDKPGISNEQYYELLYFDESNGKSHYVDFRKVHAVLLCILDLCVFHEEGKAKMTITDTCPAAVIPAWKKRFDILKKCVEKIIQKHKEYQNFLKECIDTNSEQYKQYRGQKYEKNILNLLLPKSTNYKTGLFKGKIDVNEEKESLSYDCQRIGRLAFPRAGEMLTRYSQFISRFAFEHDFENARKKRIKNE